MKQFDWLIKNPIAHRGLHDGNKEVFENSLTAFQRAVDEGYGIECDLHIDKDGVPIVFHDDTLDRVTSENGQTRARSINELSKIKLGGTSDHIPSLQELLDLVDGKVPLVLELKGIEGEDDGFVKAVVELLQNYKANVAIMSFNHWLVRDMATLCGDIPFGLTAEGDDSTSDVHMNFYDEVSFDFISYDVNALPNRFVAKMRERHDMPVITWTNRTKAHQENTQKYADQVTFELMDPR